ncbi:hypothetical protein Ate01nite_43430 [Actinoplanes teichomyceticus]|nr:hypothetical protein Ate01nite_43430 [Actinoplanes teichomyceticus]
MGVAVIPTGSSPIMRVWRGSSRPPVEGTGHGRGGGAQPATDDDRETGRKRQTGDNRKSDRNPEVGHNPETGRHR